MNPLFAHLIACNRFDGTSASPLLLDGARIGFVQRADRAAFAAIDDVFEVSESHVAIKTAGAGSGGAGRRLDAATDRLVAAGIIPKRRREPFAIARDWGAPPLFTLDRGAVPYFGAMAYGVHVNGLVRTDAGLSVWVGRRAADREVAPGKLDNLVGGGIAAGHDAAGTVVKECQEEAGIDEALARKALPAGIVRYRMTLGRGMRDDLLFLYDLWLAPDFVPCCEDGEVAEFMLLPLAECLNLVATGDTFKFNVNLVIIDLGVRYGLIGPGDPDYIAMNMALRGGLVSGPR